MKDLFYLISSCQNLQEYVDEIARLIHNPFWIMDQSFHILALSHSPDARFLKNKFYSEESLMDHVAKWQKSGMLDAVKGSLDPIRLYDEEFQKNVIILDIYNQNNAIGRLTVFEETPVDDDTVRKINAGAAIYLRTMSSARNHAPAEQMLASLIDGDSVSQEEISSILARSDIPAPKRWRIICMRPAGDDKSYLAEAMRSDIDRIAPLWVTITRNECIFALIPAADTKILQQTAAIKTGCSIAFNDLNDVKSYATQALFALNNGKNAINYFVDELLDFVPAVLSEKLSLDSLVSPQVRKILDYDKEYGTHYFETLAAYYESNESKAKTSRLLQVHLNTIKYRLQQMSQLFSIDFDKDSKNIRLSLILLNYMKKSRQSQ